MKVKMGDILNRPKYQIDPRIHSFHPLTLVNNIRHIQSSWLNKQIMKLPIAASYGVSEEMN